MCAVGIFFPPGFGYLHHSSGWQFCLTSELHSLCDFYARTLRQCPVVIRGGSSKKVLHETSALLPSTVPQVWHSASKMCLQKKKRRGGAGVRACLSSILPVTTAKPLSPPPPRGRARESTDERKLVRCERRKAKGGKKRKEARQKGKKKGMRKMTGDKRGMGGRKEQREGGRRGWRWGGGGAGVCVTGDGCSGSDRKWEANGKERDEGGGH